MNREQLEDTLKLLNAGTFTFKGVDDIMRAGKIISDLVDEIQKLKEEDGLQRDSTT